MNKNNKIECVATILSISGAIFNAMILWQGFVLWIISNSLWIWYGRKIKSNGLILTFLVYNIISIYGLIMWLKILG